MLRSEWMPTSDALAVPHDVVKEIVTVFARPSSRSTWWCACLPLSLSLSGGLAKHRRRDLNQRRLSSTI